MSRLEVQVLQQIIGEQMIWLNDPACCGSCASKPRGLDACKGGQVVHKSRTQASCHNMQGFVDRHQVGVFTVTRT